MDQAAFELETLLEEHRKAGELYLEFLRVTDLNCGLYILPAGGIDPQQPHDEDEVYYIIRGNGKFSVAEVEQEVGPGTILYVKKEVDHRFHSIINELMILVFFASAG